MDQESDNPKENKLPPGLDEAQLKEAITSSGYPLQTVVSDLLRSKLVAEDANFNVQEEWSYIDKDSDALRTIDLLAELRLYDFNSQPRVRPHLNLLIECKQSTLPYVFFATTRTPMLSAFPTIAGLHRDKIKITSDDDPSSWTFTIPHILDLDTHAFQTARHTCHTLSKCVRKGSAVGLSGDETYHGLILPLSKALQHFVHCERPVDTAWYFDCHAALAVAVVDAPMISVASEPSGPLLTAAPWVRVVRHEYDASAERFDRDQRRVIDVVHKDFLEAYLEDSVLPFAWVLAERALRHQAELATGSGFVSGMERDGWRNLEGRLMPKSSTASVGRMRAIGRALGRAVANRGKGQHL